MGREIRQYEGVEPPRKIRAWLGEAGIQPIGMCLVCGHVKVLAVWKGIVGDSPPGVCGPCRDAAVHLRGDCSAERGCLCDRFAREGS